jgi:hypothetical protein
MYVIDDVVEYINNKNNYFDVSFYKDNVFALVNEKTERLNKKIDGKHKILQDICLVGKGMETAADDVFLFDKYPKRFPKKFIKKRITGKNIDRYFFNDEGDYIIYFEDVEDFKKLPSSIQEHLKVNKKSLSERATVKNEGRVWWRYSRPMHKEYYHLPKLYCSRRSFRNTFCYDEGFDHLGFSNMTIVFATNEKVPIKYILALLNSKLLTFRYKSIGKQTGGGSFEYFPNGIGKLPIAEADEKTQDHFASHVDQMLELKKQEAAEPNQQLKKMITRQINSVDKAIDSAVYELYNLNEDEVKVVEGDI